MDEKQIPSPVTDKSKAYLMPTSHLAYLGDAVMELMVRKKLVTEGIPRPQEKAASYVTAVAQSAAAERLLPVFTDEEADIYKRGRNNTHTSPKSATHTQYSRATGLECVFAYVYLCGDAKRLWELFNIGFPVSE